MRPLKWNEEDCWGAESCPKFVPIFPLFRSNDNPANVCVQADGHILADHSDYATILKADKVVSKKVYE